MYFSCFDVHSLVSVLFVRHTVYTTAIVVIIIDQCLFFKRPFAPLRVLFSETPTVLGCAEFRGSIRERERESGCWLIINSCYSTLPETPVSLCVAILCVCVPYLCQV